MKIITITLVLAAAFVAGGLTATFFAPPQTTVENVNILNSAGNGLVVMDHPIKLESAAILADGLSIATGWTVSGIIIDGSAKLISCPAPVQPYPESSPKTFIGEDCTCNATGYCICKKLGAEVQP